MASCPVCGGRVRLILRGFGNWRCRACRSLLRLGDPNDLVHPLVLPFVMLLPFLRDLRILECSPDYCAVCHYNLAGNVSGICPECGSPTPERKQPSAP